MHDQLFKHGIILGPMQGIPVLVKDNVDTGDKMQTTAGSFALLGIPALQDSTVAANLRGGGAVILGKTNLSEWANFRSFESSADGRVAAGRPIILMASRAIPADPVRARPQRHHQISLAVSFGTETDGSIVCPGNVNGVVALKPTVGLTSRAGIVPISHVAGHIWSARPLRR